MKPESSAIYYLPLHVLENNYTINLDNLIYFI